LAFGQPDAMLGAYFSPMNRRHFLSASSATLASVAFSTPARAAGPGRQISDAFEPLNAAEARPVLDVSSLKDPVIIETIDVLYAEPNKYIVRIRAKGGATGLAVGNELQMGFLYPILKQRIAPYLIGKDAREWEKLLEGVYVHASNYKMQGLPFWLPLANVEFAIIDLLGRLAGRSAAQLLGGVVRDRVEVYQAFNDREKTPEASVANVEKTIAVTGAKAVKFKVGGRMSNNRDSLPGRTEAIIPLMRERLGEAMTLYADSNGSYDVSEAIRVGRILEAHDVAFYEEPVPFDRFGDTKAVADALTIPIAGGEQDASIYNFKWSLAHDALQIVQPDLFYFGGFVRSIRVARMAAALGRDCTPHISGTGLGFVYMLHFAACVPNIGAHQEFKGVSDDVPAHCPTSSLQSEGGFVTPPSGPGLGVELDPAWIEKARVL
jgi:L-alanine-DL-glutamate epimerase-like enolase superfamily enzyme